MFSRTWIIISNNRVSIALGEIYKFEKKGEIKKNASWRHFLPLKSKKIVLPLLFCNCKIWTCFKGMLGNQSETNKFACNSYWWCRKRRILYTLMVENKTNEFHLQFLNLNSINYRVNFFLVKWKKKSGRLSGKIEKEFHDNFCM